MSSQNGPLSAPDSSAQEVVQDALARFDAYARIRGGRDSIFLASRSTPQQEQRAFDDLALAMAGLRRAFGD
ncbi:hypothetical protein [Streptomyces europaeiscabiei]|uniref:hypothetical protein n=1 Tax=Streptomyces europaeiscabiei TaxID=146819 RepID=UPI002E179596